MICLRTHRYSAVCPQPALQAAHLQGPGANADSCAGWMFERGSVFESAEDGVAVGTGVLDRMRLFQLCLHGVAPGVPAHSLSLECLSLPWSPDDTQVHRDSVWASPLPTGGPDSSG